MWPFCSLRASSPGRSDGGAGKGKESLQLRLWKLNSTSNSPVAGRRLSCKISANQRKAETSANVNKHWKTRAKGNDVISNVISANQHFAPTFSMQIFKIQGRSCKLSARAPRRACSQATVLLLPFYIFPQALSFCVLCFGFQFQTTWCSPGNLPFFFSHTYERASTCIGRHLKKKQFSGVPSRGLKWDNKTYKLKCSIFFGDWKKRNSSLLAPPLPPF